MKRVKPTGYPDTPNLDKEIEAQDKAVVLTDFVDWLNDEKHYQLAEYNKYGDSDGRLWPASYGGYNRLFAEFFGVDYNQAEVERRAVLEWLQAKK